MSTESPLGTTRRESTERAAAAGWQWPPPAEDLDTIARFDTRHVPVESRVDGTDRRGARRVPSSGRRFALRGVRFAVAAACVFALGAPLLRFQQPPTLVVEAPPPAHRAKPLLELEPPSRDIRPVPVQRTPLVDGVVAPRQQTAAAIEPAAASTRTALRAASEPSPTRRRAALTRAPHTSGSSYARRADISTGRVEPERAPVPAFASVATTATLSGEIGGAVPVPLPLPVPRRREAGETIDDEPAVRAALARYGAAYSSLDAGAASAVWPAVDARALAHAFDALESQQVVFDRCEISLEGSDARAACRGSATYVPRVGDRRPRTEPRQWTFRLEKASDTSWRIATADIRSR